ncbi:MAG TPA: CPBP family intramembrane glutamic endopeptidase, partial [Puia sp.]|nr:CPBP family intramembrane glutamic endopeptidase [Puia sp.]
PRFVDFGKLLQALFSIVLFGLTGYLYGAFTFYDRIAWNLGLRRGPKPVFFLLAVLLLLVSFPLEEWLGELNKQIPLWHWMLRTEDSNDRLVDAFLKVRHPLDPVINVLVMAAIPAFCEEICFRGALQRVLIQICKHPWAGIIVTAFLFSFFHFEFQGFIPRMFLGLLLGAAYWYSGSLWVSILAHFVFNGVQIVVAMANPGVVSKNASIPLLIVLFSIVLVVGLLGWMRRRSTVTFASVYE